MSNKAVAAALFVLAFLLAGAGSSVCAQSSPHPPSPLDPGGSSMKTPQDSSSDKNRDMGPMEEEMLKRREIKREEKEYQDNMDRAKEVAALGSQLQESFEHNKVLSRDDARKLDRLEKLTRKIRSDAGGSDEDEPLQNPPQQLEPAVKRLAEVSQALWKVVEKTPKRVVSASVIEQANVLLELTHYTRKLIQ